MLTRIPNWSFSGRDFENRIKISIFLNFGIPENFSRFRYVLGIIFTIWNDNIMLRKSTSNCRNPTCMLKNPTNSIAEIKHAFSEIQIITQIEKSKSNCRNPNPNSKTNKKKINLTWKLWNGNWTYYFRPDVSKCQLI